MNDRSSPHSGVAPSGLSGAAPGGLDPAALQVLIARLSGIAEEMGAALQRSAFSPNIKERSDCSAAVFDPSGRLLAQAEHIPVHLGSMPASVAAAIEAVGHRIGPGEQAILNDPYAGGTHLNDITIVAPCFASPSGASAGDRHELVGWVANRAHHADVGGSAPGSIPADATEIFAEGLRIPPVLMTDEVIALLLANSRTPTERNGDLAAQVGANEVGVRRLAELTGSPFDAVIEHGRRRCAEVLGSLPGGTWSATDVLDSTGPGPAQQRPAELRLSITVTAEPSEDGGASGARAGVDLAGGALSVAGNESVERPRSITFDFTGTDAQRAGNTNAVRSVTVSAVGFALRSALDPTLPANAGVMEPVRIITPPGSIVAADNAVAVGAGNVEVSQRVADLCQRVLAEMLPDRVPAAGQGTMNNLLVGGSGVAGVSPAEEERGQPWVYYETIGGGQGGRPPDPRTPYDTATRGMSGPHPGMTNTDRVDPDSSAGVPGQSGIHTAMTNTRNTPVEALERAYPMRVLRYRLRRGSGGAGSAPGGEGIERDLQVLEDATVSIISERRVSRPWGLAGGEPGAVGENWLLRGGDEARAERLPDKCTIQLKAGDVLRMLTPGGGGWGRARGARAG